MKQHLYLLALVAICFTACGPLYIIQQDPVPTPPPASPSPTDADPDDVTYQNFYDQLSPYGQWIEDPNYGYVWLPDAGADFKPYATNGHWVYTEEGWTWDSNYPWGWAAFHYGRWFFQDGYGWMWLPGTEWAPAWVTWRNSDEYYGWAPMEPDVSFDAAYGGGYIPPVFYWNFVPHRYISSPQVNNFYVRETNNVTIINQTTVLRNATMMNRPRNSRYGGGPDAGEVGRYSGAAVRPLAIRESHSPGERADNANLTIYRPRVNGGDSKRPGNAGRPFAPSRTQTLNNAKPVNRTVYGERANNNNGKRDDRGNGARTNTGFPNSQGSQRTNAASQSLTPASQSGNPSSQSLNPASQPANQSAAPARQPDNRFGRPSSSNSQPNQQPANQAATSTNQSNQQQSMQNQQQSMPNQQRSVPNQVRSVPNQQRSAQNQSGRQQSVSGQPAQQQSSFGRPVNAMPAGRPYTPQQANSSQPKPVDNSPKAEQKPATSPQPTKKVDPVRPGRS